jgi:hypothetical protein
MSFFSHACNRRHHCCRRANAGRQTNKNAHSFHKPDEQNSFLHIIPVIVRLRPTPASDCRRAGLAVADPPPAGIRKFNALF